MKAFKFGFLVGLLLVLSPSHARAAGPIVYSVLVSQSMSASFVTPINPDMLYKEWGSIQASWTCSACTGTLSLSVSNDGITYSTYTGSSTSVNGSGNFMWNMLFVGFRYVELVYTEASGSGTMNATLVAKGE